MAVRPPPDVVGDPHRERTVGPVPDPVGATDDRLLATVGDEVRREPVGGEVLPGLEVEVASLPT